MMLKCWYQSSNDLSLLLVDKPVEMELNKKTYENQMLVH